MDEKILTAQEQVEDVDRFIDPFVRCFWCKTHMENITSYQECFQTKAYCEKCKCFYQLNWDEKNNWELIQVLEEKIAIKSRLTPEMFIPVSSLINTTTGVGYDIHFDNDNLNSTKLGVLMKRNNLLALGGLTL